jgi:hypothetical protein
LLSLGCLRTTRCPVMALDTFFVLCIGPGWLVA